MRWKKNDNSINVETPAKLNLFLEVLGKREDGFHELQTVITAIDLVDQLKISRVDHLGIQLQCRWRDPDLGKVMGDLPNDSSNLVYRAAELFLKSTGKQMGLEIELIKSIPSQAGLGGASGNAAGTLLGLNEWLDGGLSDEQLVELAAQLGSDIPFFIRSGYALCEGRGEQITQLNIDPQLCFVVVKPSFGLSTRDIFSKLELDSNVISLNVSQLTANQVDWSRSLFNRLQQPAQQVSEEIGKVCDFLEHSGCLASQMTGSGSCCFGLCADRRHAEQVLKQVHEAKIGFAFVCENLPNFSVPM